MISQPKALLFDIFGTVFDWRTSIIAEGASWSQSRGVAVDWERFADTWRGGYHPTLEKVSRGEIPWAKLDVLHRQLLDDLLPQFGLAQMSAADRAHWNLVWHRLQPWPGAVAGLARLKTRYTIAPLSNGNFSMLTALSKQAGICWDAIISVELAKHYKPDPEAYLTAIDLLDLRPGEAMLVAAHFPDLEAARRCGLRTGFVRRPNEWGPNGKTDHAASGQFDVVAGDFADLAEKLGT